MKHTIFSTLLLAGLLISAASCDNEDELFLQPESETAIGDKVLNREWMSMDGKSRDYLSSVYYYDDAGRILKVEHPGGQRGEITGEIMSYEDYYYNAEGLPEKIVYYTRNENVGYLNLQTEVFTYSDEGILTEKTTVYPVVNQTEKVTYSYSKGLLVKETFNDSSGKSTHTKEYAYNGGTRPVSEVLRSDGTIYETLIHRYNEGLLMHTDYYRGAKREVHLREILYTYDAGNNLIKKVSNELSIYSSYIGGTTLYEYFD